MKRLLLALLIISLSCVPSLAVSAWTPIAEKLQNSTVFIEISGADGDGSCSGFVIDSKKKQVLTAGHCDGEKLLVDGTPAIKIYKDARKDLMVLRAYNIYRPALKLAKDEPSLGDEVASFGFGFGLESPMFRIAHVSNTHLEIESLSGPFLILDNSVIPGQSGGPIVNVEGDVIGIVQRHGDGLAIGVGVDTIREKVGRYFE